MDKEKKLNLNKVYKRFDQTDKKFEVLMNFLYKEMPTRDDLKELASKEELRSAKSPVLSFKPVQF